MHEVPLPDISLFRDQPPDDWDAYVRSRPDAAAYHLASWPAALAGIFGLETFYLRAEGVDGRPTGVLPLIRQHSLVFGNRLVSLPFVNYGGPLADDEDARRALMARAVELGRSLRVDQIELRDVVPPPQGWLCRTDKAAVKLSLPATADELSRSFGSKLRSQIRRAARDPHDVQVGGIERLDDFYPVFAAVMHELGTPVYPRRFFAELLRRLPHFCSILTVRRESRPVAAAFLVDHGNTLEIPWAATIAVEKSRATNMLLYARALEFAVQRGYETFDFGRSTIDSGPYRFKLQWGAQPVQLHWAVWPEQHAAIEERKPSVMRAAATRLWARLPLAVANRLGPLISPSLPW